MSAKVPVELTGVWRREEITAPGGYRDDTTRVFWVQADSWYGDIRLRIDIPRRDGATGFDDYADAELVELAETQGFAGQLTVTPKLCAWRRDVDYQPPGPVPDEGTWKIDGDILVEGGVHIEYEEIWRLEPGSRGLRAAFAQDDSQGLLVLAGDHFLRIEGRRTPLPSGESLPALVKAALAAGDREGACALLDMPISYGRIGDDWRIVLSTLPWREGRRLWSSAPRYAPETGELVDDRGAVWRQLEVHDPERRLPHLFTLASGPDEAG